MDQSSNLLDLFCFNHCGVLTLTLFRFYECVETKQLSVFSTTNFGSTYDLMRFSVLVSRLMGRIRPHNIMHSQTLPLTGV